MTTTAKFPTFNWMRGVARDVLITIVHRFVLIRLCLYRDEKNNGQCDPGYQTVADELGVGRATVFRAVDVGIKRGWLADFPNHGGRARRNFVFTFPVQQSHGSDGSTVSPVRRLKTPTVSGKRSNSLKNARQQSQAKLEAAEPAGEFATNGQRERAKRTGSKSQTQPPLFASLESEEDARSKPDRNESDTDGNNLPNRAEGGKAEIARYSARDGGQEARWDVRQFTVSALTHYQAGPSPCVWIGNLRKGFRKWSSICINPDSYWFWIIEQDGRVIYDSRSDIPCAVTPPDPPPPNPESAAFPEFWAAYPNKKDEDDARKAFAAAIKRGADPAALIDGAKRYAVERAGQDPKFTKHPATWLTKGSWKNQPAPTGPVIDQQGNIIATPPPRRSRPQTIEEASAELFAEIKAGRR